MVQNAAARVLTRTRKYDHITPVLSTLHWLSIKHRIDFTILLITYKTLNGLAPQYLIKLLSHYSPPHPLRSQNSGNLILPRISKSTAGGRSFSYLAPKLWNNLPNTVLEADTLCQFKSSSSSSSSPLLSLVQVPAKLAINLSIHTQHAYDNGVDRTGRQGMEEKYSIYMRRKN